MLWFNHPPRTAAVAFMTCQKPDAIERLVHTFALLLPMHGWRRWASMPLALLVLGQGALPVVVIVQNVRDTRGIIRVAICPKGEFLQPHCLYVGHTPARAGEVRVLIAGVPPGVYAAQAFHDANDNQILDRNWMGMPEEGLGFSNNAQFHFGPPAFDDAAFALPVPGGQVVVLLRYFDK